MTAYVPKLSCMDIQFSTWINDQLRERKWTQADLARESGLTRQAIGYYLSGKSKSPDPEALTSIARALNFPPTRVFRAAGILPPAPEVSEEIEMILNEVARLPKEDQEEILAFVRMKSNLRVQREKVNG